MHAHGVALTLHQPRPADLAAALATGDDLALLQYLRTGLHARSIGGEQAQRVIAVGLGHIAEFKIRAIQIRVQQRIRPGQRKRADPESRREQEQNQQQKRRPRDGVLHFDSVCGEVPRCMIIPLPGIPA